jgi:thiamine biosynthesis lipoprotein
MGMPVIVDIGDRDVDPAGLERAFDWLRFVERTFSTYRTDSEISRLNRGEIELASTHPAVRSVLRRCEALRLATGGYFDARAPYLPAGGGPQAGRGGAGSVDPSGLVKGWSVAGAGRILERAGARNYAINAGGDILVRGRPAGREPWRVGIQHPRMRDQVAMVLALSDTGIATSGAYERGEHIIDPHTGRAPDAVLSVTVIGADLAQADAYATAAYAMGADGAAWCAGQCGYEAVVIASDDTVLTTSGVDRLRV